MGLTALGGHVLQEGDKQGVVLRSSRTQKPGRPLRPFLQGKRRCQSDPRSSDTAIRIALTFAQVQSLHRSLACPAAETTNGPAERASKHSGMSARILLQRPAAVPILRNNAAGRRAVFDVPQGFSSIISGICQ